MIAAFLSGFWFQYNRICEKRLVWWSQRCRLGGLEAGTWWRMLCYLSCISLLPLKEFV